MLELRNKLLLLGLEVEASLIPTFTLDPRLIGGVCGELFTKVALMSASNCQVLSSFQLATLPKEDKPSSSYLSGGQVWSGHCSGGGLR